jgi:hypothetical protein
MNDDGVTGTQVEKRWSRNPDIPMDNKGYEPYLLETGKRRTRLNYSVQVLILLILNKTNF